MKKCITCGELREEREFYKVPRFKRKNQNAELSAECIYCFRAKHELPEVYRGMQVGANKYKVLDYWDKLRKNGNIVRWVEVECPNCKRVFSRRFQSLLSGRVTCTCSQVSNKRKALMGKLKEGI